MSVSVCDMGGGGDEERIRVRDLMNIIPHAIVTGVPAPPISPYYPTSTVANTTTATATATTAADAAAAAVVPNSTTTTTTNITSSNTTFEVRAGL